MNADERIAVGHEIMSAPVLALCRLAYPTLYVVHDPSGTWGLTDSSPLPPCSPLSMAALSDSGAYLLDNGRMLVLWVGKMLSPQWTAEVGAVMCVKSDLLSCIRGWIRAGFSWVRVRPTPKIVSSLSKIFFKFDHV